MVGSTLNEIKDIYVIQNLGKEFISLEEVGILLVHINLEMEGGETASDQQYKSIWHELITFSNPFQHHDQKLLYW